MQTHRFQNIKHQDNKIKMSRYTYRVFPYFMIDPCHVLIFPSLFMPYAHVQEFGSKSLTIRGFEKFREIQRIWKMSCPSLTTSHDQGLLPRQYKE